MTKQEFMAMSLPYGLKISMTKLSECVKNTNNYDTRYFKQEFEISEHSNDFRKSYPILRPLSELTKEIEHGGGKIIPVIDIFLKNVREIKGRYIIFKNGYSTTIGELKFKQVQKLIEWHFDIAGLIDKGEAIDYSTLEGFSF